MLGHSPDGLGERNVLSEAAARAAVEAYRLLRLDGYSRSDFRLDDDDGRRWIIETTARQE